MKQFLRRHFARLTIPRTRWVNGLPVYVGFARDSATGKPCGLYLRVCTRSVLLS